MAKSPITLNVDTTLLPTLVTALASKVGWQAQVDDGTGNMVANPVTQATAAKQRLINLALNDLTDYNNQQALVAVQAPNATLIS